MKDIIKSLEGYKLHEKLILLCSRADQSETVDEYIQNLILDPTMNWDMFLGVLLNNRVNGVVYNKLVQFKKVPAKILFFLKAIYNEQAKRVEQHLKEIQIVNKAFKEAGIHYAFLKGAYMNSFVYKLGERNSNDTDIMVLPKDLIKCGRVLEDIGYKQGSMEGGEFRPASRKEIVFAKLNTYEIIPYIKIIENPHFPFHMVDINFKLSNDETKGISDRMLDTVRDIENEQYHLQIMSDENFLIFLCIHLYREATMVLKIMSGSDLTLYKFMDVHYFIHNVKDSINWDLLYKEAKILGRIEDVYFTLYYVEELYPGTLNEEILNKLKPLDINYLDEYKGRSNSEEVYKWGLGFKERVLNSERILDAMENLSKEYERYDDMLEKLQNE